MKIIPIVRHTACVVGIVIILFFLTDTNFVRAEAITITSRATVPINWQINVPGAQEGSEDTVNLTGNVHYLTQLTLDEAGGFHLVTHANPQGVQGIGLQSSARYRGTGATQVILNGKTETEY